MSSKVEQQVRRRAKHRCEYCLLPQSASALRHQMDHIIARQHGGGDDLSNLALCCIACNLHKGPNIAGLDPDTQALTRLFHPRQDRWNLHFAWDGPILLGKTAIGATTIRVLSMNQAVMIASRLALIEEGDFPPR